MFRSKCRMCLRLRPQTLPVSRRKLTLTSEATEAPLAAVEQSNDVFVVDERASIPPAKHSSHSAVGKDILSLVTDALKEEREAQIQKRRRMLYDITHPNPMDYGYGGKLVPPPPLSFGSIAPESVALGRRMMCEPTYSLVRSATSTDVFFEINHLYLEVAMVGKANAGKSTLLNAILEQKVARSSAQPNSTRRVSFYQSVTPEELHAFATRRPSKLVTLPAGGLQLTFVDVPGIGVAGMSDSWRDGGIAATDAYLGTRRGIGAVLLCIDAQAGVTALDLKYMEWLGNLHGVFFVVLTRCDAVSHARICSVMAQLYKLFTQDGARGRRMFRKAYPFVLPTSAVDGTNIDDLRGLIVEATGMITGDRLRRILCERRREQSACAEDVERERVAAVRRLEQIDAKEKFFEMKSLPPPMHSEDFVQKDVAAHHEKSSGTHPAESIDLDLPRPEGLVEHVKGYRLNFHCPKTRKPTPAPEPSQSSMKTFASEQMVETGLSQFFKSLATVRRYEGAPTAWARARAHKWDRFHRAPGARVFFDEGDGVLRRSTVLGMQGHRYIESKNGEIDRANSGEVAAYRMAALCSKQKANAPWEALQTLQKQRMNIMENKGLTMTEKQFANYEKRRGRVVEDFQKFSDTVTSRQFMRERRMVRTEWSRQELDLQHDNRIPFKAQPLGLWRRYGSAPTQWNTSSVIGA